MRPDGTPRARLRIAAASSAALLLFGCAAGAPTSADSSPTAYASISAAEALAGNIADHDDGNQLSWDTGTQIPIALDQPDEIAGIKVADGLITFTASGSYRVTGTLADGGLVVDTDDDEPVYLVMDGVDISNSNGAAISVDNAGLVVLVLSDGSENTIVDGTDYADESDGAADSTLDSTADLTIAGRGSLTVTGRHSDAISVSAGLVIRDATVNVTAAADGIRGSDYLVIDSGVVNVTAGGDGLKSDNSTDAKLGYISLGEPTVKVTAAGKGLDAATDVIVAAASVSVSAGGGSIATTATDAAAISGHALVVADDGTFALDAATDGVSSNGTVAINGGEWAIAAGNDGVHGDLALLITGGTLAVSRSTDGLEAEALTITGGKVSVVATDDGLNASASEATTAGSGAGANGMAAVILTGGKVTVDAMGDGIDANGSLSISGGEVLVHGPTSDANGSIDYDSTFEITGGTLIAGGSAAMARAPSADSPQESLMASVTGRAASSVEFKDGSGRVLAAFVGGREFGNVLVSTPDVDADATYTIYVDGKLVGTTTSAEAVSSQRGQSGGPASPTKR